MCVCTVTVILTSSSVSVSRSSNECACQHRKWQLPTYTHTHTPLHTHNISHLPRHLSVNHLCSCNNIPTFQLIFPLDHMSHMRYVDPADSWLSAWMSWLLVSWGQHVTFVIYCKWHFTALGMNSVSGAYSHTHTAIYILNVFNVSVCSLRDCECLFDVLHDIQNI